MEILKLGGQLLDIFNFLFRQGVVHRNSQVGVLEDTTAVLVFHGRTDRVSFFLVLLFGHDGDALRPHHPALNVVVGELRG